jgi:putative Flp pilus-assembly TadE/G-like protein
VDRQATEVCNLLEVAMSACPNGSKWSRSTRSGGNCSEFQINQPTGRRGSIVILAAFFAVALAMLVACGVDVGFLMVAKTEVQRSSDASALAAAGQLLHERSGRKIVTGAYEKQHVRSQPPIL